MIGTVVGLLYWLLLLLLARGSALPLVGAPVAAPPPLEGWGEVTKIEQRLT